jgi:transposase InsO family protein
MASKFQFKFSPESLPKLTSRGDNYPEWRSAWQIAFRYAELWPIVSGKTKRPDTAGNTQNDWDANDNKALVMLISAVHSDLTMSVTSCDTATEAWAHLAGRFDRDTGNMSIALFRSLTNLRYNDGDDLRLHLDEFHQRWTRMANRCAASSQTVAKAMTKMFESDEVKGSFFLSTLPDTMDTIIDNLSTRNLTAFKDIEPKILDIADRHSLNSTDSTAYAARQAAARSNQGPRSTTTLQECTWCRKHNLTFIGHVYTNCNELKRHKELQDKDKDKSRSKDKNKTQPQRRTRDGNGKQHKGNSADMGAYSDDSDDDVTGVHAFSAAAPTAVDLTDVQPSQEVNAHAAIPQPLVNDSPVWLFDTGASRHMSGCSDDFTSLAPAKGFIRVAGGIKLPIQGIGLVRLRCQLPDGSTTVGELTKTLYSSELYNTRLFSWTSVRQQYNLSGKGDNIYLLTKHSQPALWAKYQGGIMRLQTKSPLATRSPEDVIASQAVKLDVTTKTASNSSSLLAAGNFTSYDDFHQSIGHLVVRNPGRIYADGHLVPARPDDFNCDPCNLSKSTHTRPVAIHKRSTKLFEIIYTDLSGKFSRPSLGGARYYISFIEGSTRATWVRFLKRKADAPRVIKDFIAYVNTQFRARVMQVLAVSQLAGSIIAQIKSDNGGEYTSSDLKAYFRKEGIEHNLVPPYHHEVNGVPERFNRTIMQMARSMIPSDDLLVLWAEAIQTATYLKNRAPHSADKLHRTPYELLHGFKPYVGHLHPFGANCYVHIPVEARKPGTKLLDRAEKGIFVGYGRNDKTLRVYVPARNVVLESRDVSVIQSKNGVSTPLFQLESSLKDSEPASGDTRAEPELPIPRQSTDLIESTPAPARLRAPTAPPPMRSLRSRSNIQRPERYRDDANAVDAPMDDIHYEQLKMAHAMIAVLDMPSTYAEGMTESNKPLWQPPIRHEIKAHEDNNTWELTDATSLPPNVKLVGTRWVMTVKKDEHDQIVKRKARIVAQGFSQRPGVDYDDTYSPVIRYDSLRLIIFIAIFKGWLLRQIDFDAAYLNGSLQHVIYARCPPGVGRPGQVLRLLKALYGLKQSGREWYSVLSTWLTGNGFTQATFDPCVFISHNLILGVYVDDLLLAGTSDAITQFLDLTHKRFRFKDLGRPKLLLGLEIDYLDNGVKLHQRTYVEAILRRYRLDQCNGRLTPLDPNSFPQRSPSDQPIDLERQKLHQSIVGSVNFLAMVSRPDLSFPVSMLASYNANPSEVHLGLARQLLRYIRKTSNYGVEITNATNSVQVTMYADASFNTDPDNAKSFSGYIMKVNGSTISWSSKRQSCVARSTCEAEYMAASRAASHLVWARQALGELIGIGVKPTSDLLVDNEPAESLIKDNKISDRSKHIDVHFHFVRERFIKGEYQVRHVASKDNLADVCTKALPRPTLELLGQQIRSAG